MVVMTCSAQAACSKVQRSTARPTRPRAACEKPQYILPACDLKRSTSSTSPKSRLTIRNSGPSNAQKVSGGPVHARAYQPYYTNLVQALHSCLQLPDSSHRSVMPPIDDAPSP